MDAESEHEVQKALDELMATRNQTIIVIAHRLSTIRDADKIVVLVNGKKTEEGNHNELMERFPDGTYAEFCRKQASSEAESPTKVEEDPDEIV